MDEQPCEVIIRLAKAIAPSRPTVRWVMFDVCEPLSHATWLYLGVEPIDARPCPQQRFRV